MFVFFPTTREEGVGVMKMRGNMCVCLVEGKERGRADPSGVNARGQIPCILCLDILSLSKVLRKGISLNFRGALAQCSSYTYSP